MAKKVITITEVVDDLDGTTLDSKNSESVEFAIDGTTYVIDLSKANAQKLRDDFYKYVKVATKKGRGTRKPSGSGRSPQELEAVRQWAASEGIEVAARGRIKSTVLEAYDKAH